MNFDIDTTTGVNDAVLTSLRNQYKNSTVVSREFSGCGFYTEFSVPDRLASTIGSLCFQIGDVVASFNGISDALGFILYVRGGVICLLEGYNSVDDTWPQVYNEVTLSFFPHCERDMKLIRESYAHHT